MDNLISIDDIRSMSPETFQNKLWLWFKENGVITEIKAHIRRQMIRAIKNTEFVDKDRFIQEANVNASCETKNKQNEKPSINISVLNKTKNVKHRNIHDNEDHANNLIQMVYEDLQLEFDKEINIAKKEEREKFDDLTKVQEENFSILLFKEKMKFKKKERTLKKKLQKEIKLERQKMLEAEGLRELENERNLQIDLEKERRKLMEECRIMTANKNTNNVSILEIQQRSLEIGLKAVQQQSNRLRKKEERLNKIMSNLPHNDVRHRSYQITTINDETNLLIPTNKDVLSYNKTTQTDNESCNPLVKELKGFNEAICQTNIIDKKSVKCQTFFSGDAKHSSKLVQTINDSNSIGCQTKCFAESDQLKVNSNVSPNIFKETSQSNVIPDAFLSFENKYTNTIFNTEDSLYSTEESTTDTPIFDSTNTLKEDNSRLKLYNEQQREHIKQLSKQQASLSNEVIQSNKEIHRLSNQLALLKSGLNDDKKLLSSVKFSQNTAKCDNSRVKDCLDSEFIKLKEKIRILERESDENDKSYFEIKRQLENSTKSFINSYASSVSDLQSNDVIKPPIDIRSSTDFFKGAGAIRREAKNIYSVSNYSNLNPDQVYDFNTNAKANVLQNYLTTSHDFTKYNTENPKLFADMLLKRNVSKNYNRDTTEYCKFKTNDIFDKYITNSNPKEKFKCSKQQITCTQKVMELSNENKHFFLHYDLEKKKDTVDQLNLNEIDFESVLKKNKDYKSFHYDMKNMEIIRKWPLSPSSKTVILKKSINDQNQPAEENPSIGKRIKFSQRKLVNKSHIDEKSSLLENKGQSNSKTEELITIDSKSTQVKQIDSNNQREVKNCELIDDPKISSESSNAEEIIDNNLTNVPKVILESDSVKLNYFSDDNKPSKLIVPFVIANKAKIDMFVDDALENDNNEIINEDNFCQNNSSELILKNISATDEDLIIIKHDSIQPQEKSHVIMDTIINVSINSNDLSEASKTQNEDDDKSDNNKEDNLDDDENLEPMKSSSSKIVSESEAPSSNTSNSVSAPQISDDNVNFWKS